MGDLTSTVTDEDLQDVVNDLQGSEMSENYAAYNMKRKQQVKAEVSRPAFSEAAIVVNLIVKPMDRFMNLMFERTKLLAQLSSLGTAAPSWEQNVQTSKSVFFRAVSGALGWEMVDCYTEVWQDTIPTVLEDGFLLNESSIQTLFTMVLICISDSWRRFTHHFGGFPWKLFELAHDDRDLPTFVRLWDGFQARRRRCSHCIDLDFSAPILDIFPKSLCKATPGEQKKVFLEVRDILTDLAIFAPLASDSVEVKNGLVQRIASRRGNQAVKAPRAAREASLLQSHLTSYTLVKHFVDEETLPKKRVLKSILKRAGVKGAACLAVSCRVSCGSSNVEGHHL